MAYRAEIEIVAKGVAKVTQLQKNLNQLANQIDHLNGPGSLGDFNKQLAQATKLMSRAQQGTIEEKRAIEQYVIALNNANEAQERTNKLIAEEIRQRNGATISLKKYNASVAPPREAGSMSGRYLRPLGRSQSAVSLGPQPDRTKMLRRQAVLDRTVRRTQQLSGLQQGLAKLSQVEADARLDSARSASQQKGEMAAIAREAQKINQFSIKQMGPKPAPSSVGTGRGRTGRLGDATSSALIGGAFPLLFGQGGAAAAGGAVGGLAGGLVGGQFGFALSLVGTALGDAASKAEKFNQDLAALNARAINLGSSSLATAKNVGELARQLGKTKDETIEVLQQFSAFTEFADRASLARVFGGDASAAERLAAAQTEADLAQAILDARGKIGIEESQRLLNQLKIQESTVVELAFVEALAQKEHEITVEKARQITLLDRFLAASASSAFDIVDPAIFGEERAEKLIKEFEANRASLRDDTLKNLESLRELFATAASFDPSEPGKQGRRSRIPDLNAEIGLQERLLTLNNQIAQAKRDENPVREAALRMEVAMEQQAAKRAIIDAKRIPEAEKILEKQLLELQTDQQILDIQNRLRDIRAAEAQRVEDTVSGLQNEGALLQARLDGNEAEVALKQKIAEATKGMGVEDAKRVEDLIRANALLTEQNKIADQMKQIYGQIGMSIKTGVVDAISAAVDGTKSLAEVASNTLRNIAKQLLNIGVNFALFGTASGTGVGGGLLGGLFRADGGPVKGNSPYIVGERGPELFVPRSSGTVVPNHAMGGATVNVAVDASGSSVEGNADQAGQLGKAIGVAVQQELIKQKRPGGLLAS